VVEQLHHEKLKNLINLASYNYLGLSYRPEVIEAARDAILKYGTGSSGSPILSGTTELHEELQNKIAAFKNKESCLLFPSGYSANLGVIAGLMRSGDLVVTDQFAHASIVDGIILSKAQVRYFRHNNAADLDRKLKDFAGRKLVIVEGVYSMDGDLANLPEIVEVCQRNGARIMIDEAHSAFLFGPNGRHPSRHVLEESGRAGRLCRRFAQAHPVSEGLWTLARVLVRARTRRGGRAHQGVRARAQ